MNEQQLVEFINWLPTVVPELKDAKPEEIIQTLNKMYETEEGKTTISKLMSAFEKVKESDQSLVFEAGGKMNQLYKKKMALKAAKMGMPNKVIELAQDGSKISRQDSRQNIIGVLPSIQSARIVAIGGKPLLNNLRPVQSHKELPDHNTSSFKEAIQALKDLSLLKKR